MTIEFWVKKNGMTLISGCDPCYGVFVCVSLGNCFCFFVCLMHYFAVKLTSWNLWVFLARIRTIMACGSKSGKSEISEGGANDSVAVGDVIFVKLRGSSWWPAQVS